MTSFDRCGGGWFLLRRPLSLAGCAGWKAGDFLLGRETRGKVVRGLKVVEARGCLRGVWEGLMADFESVKRRGGRWQKDEELWMEGLTWRQGTA